MIEKIETWDKQFTHFPQFSENGWVTLLIVLLLTDCL